MPSTPIRSFWLLVVVFALLPVAQAAAPLVDARLTVALVQNNGQFETSGAASNAKPGDVLEYAAQYANRGDAPAQALMPTMPIPVGTEYLPSDREPRPTQASIDGVRWGSIPLRRPIRAPNGTVREEEVPLREYRALRWSVGTLAPGSQVTVRARVRVAPIVTAG